MNAELVEEYVDPQTNSQIYFLNNGRSFTDMTVIERAIETGRAFLFPIERFDESCVFLERMFPQVFPDLSYVRANVSKKDAEVMPEEKAFAMQYLKRDYPVFDLANEQLNLALDRAFRNRDDLKASLDEFQDRCARRFHNFHPPRTKEEIAAEQERNTQTNGDSESSEASESCDKQAG
ncbi:MAG: hypothetical protein R3C03_06590 [Pirellulaceae bacterium]